VSCHLHAPATLPPGEKATGTYWIGGWVDPTAGLANVEKRKFLTLPGLKLRPLGRPARSQSLYRLCYPTKHTNFRILSSFGYNISFPGPGYSNTENRGLIEGLSLIHQEKLCINSIRMTNVVMVRITKSEIVNLKISRAIWKLSTDMFSVTRMFVCSVVIRYLNACTIQSRKLNYS
jgi:hypothetical protein